MSKADKPTMPTLPAFTKARRAGVPIVAIETADPGAAMLKCQRSLNGREEVTPFLRWDLVRGICLAADTAPSKHVFSNIQAPDQLQDPTVCLRTLVDLAGNGQLEHTPEPETDPDRKIGAVVFMIHANRWLESTQEMQAVWNCRDAFEPKGITLVLLGPMMKLPAELKNDVVLISEPLPARPELEGVLNDIAHAADLDEAKIGDREIVTDTMSGTSAFGARQILAMSVTREGIDGDQLWDRKRKMIEQTRGLAVWKGGSRFDDLGGLSNLKEFMTRILTSGTTPCRAIGFIDEIEKGLAGAAGDLSGTSQDQLQVFLKVMQDFNIPGIILVGHPGCGKSEIAKAAGNVAKCPVIAIDTGAMKDSLVGGSEATIRAAMEVFKAVSQGKGLFIATCNKISSLPPELRRRFTLGTFFVDLPTAEERERIWPIWIKRFELKAKQPLPECEGWTGAEIKACCDNAYRTGLSLREAAQFVVPVVRSAPEAVKALRELANNRFIDASKSGVYKYEPTTTTQAAGRKIEV